MLWLRQIGAALSLRGLLADRTGLRPGSARSFLTAVVFVALALGARLLLGPWLTSAQFITFFPAVILATLFCGPAGGLLAVFLSTLTAGYLLQAEGLSSQESVVLSLFIGAAMMDVAVITALLAVVAALEGSVARIAQLNTDLRESESRFRDLVESGPDAVLIVDDENLIVLLNAEAEKLFGYSRTELLGSPIDRLIPPRFRSQHTTYTAAFRANPRTRPMGYSRELVALRKGGGEFPIDVKLGPLQAGNTGLVSCVIRDITTRKVAEERQTLLIHELNHRVKNTLATVQAIAAQTLNTTEGPDAFRAAFTTRLSALSLCHDVLTRHDWSGAQVRELVAEQLRPHEYGADGRFVLTGPDTNLAPNAALALSMALGELATNAAKYGALSVVGGRVNVTWETAPQTDGPRLHLIWRESGGPPVISPERRGFGMRLIERGLILGLGGGARVTFDPDGVVCEIDFPYQDVAA